MLERASKEKVKTCDKASEGILWEPRPRGDAVLDLKPHRAGGGAPTGGKAELGALPCGSRALAAMRRSYNEKSIRLGGLIRARVPGSCG